MKDESFLPKKKMRVIPRLSSFIYELSIRKRLSSFIFQLTTSLLLTSCSEVLYLSVEQMLPPEVMPNKASRSVGVINNFSQHNVVIVNEDAIIYPCDADSVKEQIARSFAYAGVLDRVVVLDSLLYPSDSVAPNVFSQAEVNNLCRELEVGMLYSLDYACVTVRPGDWGVARPVDVYLCSRFYTPDLDTLPGTSTLSKKTLEYWAYDTLEVRAAMPQIPYALAEVAIEPYLPSWKERERVFYYDRLCYELREGRIYVKEGNWEAAAAQWGALSNSKQRIRRFASAYNMALYYEMVDSIDQAIASLDLAAEIAIRRNMKKDEHTQIIDTSLVEKYRAVLVARKKEIAKIEEYWKLFY